MVPGCSFLVVIHAFVSKNETIWGERERGAGVGFWKLIDVINTTECSVAEYLLHGLSQSQLLFNEGQWMLWEAKPGFTPSTAKDELILVSVLFLFFYTEHCESLCSHVRQNAVPVDNCGVDWKSQSVTIKNYLGNLSKVRLCVLGDWLKLGICFQYQSPLTLKRRKAK